MFLKRKVNMQFRYKIDNRHDRYLGQFSDQLMIYNHVSTYKQGWAVPQIHVSL